MDFINNLKNQIHSITWTEDNVTIAITIVLLVIIAVLMLFKNSPVRKFTVSVVRELKLIEWIKFKDVLRYAVIVIVLCLIAVAIMTPLDALFVSLKNTYLLK